MAWAGSFVCGQGLGVTGVSAVPWQGPRDWKQTRPPFRYADRISPVPTTSPSPPVFLCQPWCHPSWRMKRPLTKWPASGATMAHCGVIPFPNHPCTLPASLAIYSCSLRSAFANDWEMEW